MSKYSKEKQMLRLKQMMTTLKANFRFAGILIFIALSINCSGNSTDQQPEIQYEWGKVSDITGGGGVNLAVYEAGNPDGYPIVFIHGFLGNHLGWNMQLSEELADEFRLIAFDLRGHGASDKPLDAENYTDSNMWADDLQAVITAMDLERPVLAGFSYAGYIFSDYIRKYGDQGTGGLIFIGPVTKAGTAEAMEVLSDEFIGLLEGLFSPNDDQREEATTSMIGKLTRQSLPDEMLEGVLNIAMMVPHEVRLAMFSRELDNDDILSQINVPTLFVHGADDKVVYTTASKRAADLVPGAELFIYEDAGHALFLDVPGRFNHDVKTFARSIRDN